MYHEGRVLFSSLLFVPEKTAIVQEDDEDDEEDEDDDEDEDDELVPGGGVQIDQDIAPATAVTTDAPGKRKSAAAEKPVSKK